LGLVAGLGFVATGQDESGLFSPSLIWCLPKRFSRHAGETLRNHHEPAAHCDHKRRKKAQKEKRKSHRSPQMMR
jgi:hypothetical protein